PNPHEQATDDLAARVRAWMEDLDYITATGFAYPEEKYSEHSVAAVVALVQRAVQEEREQACRDGCMYCAGNIAQVESTPFRSERGEWVHAYVSSRVHGSDVIPRCNAAAIRARGKE